ncbi:RNA polymerase sigma factor [Roseimaritima ulvae]|uniref:RNA polymerase sigma factor n=1 Tax=Roseimaritima ulvae TaxID=980254 RepID=UPI00138FE77B|nr:sigma-70 family RNA polymerase sigma factor [Roseimaritima ulvae]
MSNQSANESFDFQSFQQRLQAGESHAAKQLFDDYSRRLIQLAGNHIHPALRKRFDEEDVVQSVFRTFFRQQEAGKFHFQGSQQLWQLLVTLTFCKTRSHARKHTAQQRDATADLASFDEALVFDRQPSVEDAVALWEEIDVVLDGLPERAAEIITLSLEGRSRTEIADQLQLSRQTIHRILKLVQQRLSQRFAQFSAAESHESENHSDFG